ncbi:branched-chain amino acid ABC transporter permease [Rhodopila sp.]|jgi:branched-chain amino acid transport system permease protein|uniref:branched-chain amino acid ABC transporter permease n=1 Tax=Rhodopila sp. TaxID=2480087 RepID=UPI002C6DB59C|nr:branched-chain amino acid ABC transporter permease [Rhodopila sp.]HVZ10323.1 branched-chain amino acid ABC transporter permease [Rhodopila sp.]
MRHFFRSDYEQDMSLFQSNRDRFWYGLLLILLLIAPQVLGEFYVGELGGLFIFAIAGIGLMLLVGYTGLINLGHAAFLGIGAYVNAVLLKQGVPFVVTLPVAGLFTGLCGAIIGRPTLRMSGLYLAIATLAFGSIIGTVFQKWESVTGGFDGFAVPTPYLFGIPLDTTNGIYYTSFVVLLFVLWVSANLLRAPIGRALVAIRDSEVSAQSMGINLAWYKTLAFAISATMTGLAGALFAHYVRFLAPDSFDVLLSVQFITIVFVGGLGSLRGAILGSAFVRLLPQAIAMVRDDLPFGIGRLPGLEPSLFGLVLVLVILFQPGGLNGMWLKFKGWFQEYPFKRQVSHRRQKSYAKSERLK